MQWADTAMSAEPLSAAEDNAERAAWLAARAGKLTASRMKDAIDFKRDGSSSVKRADYLRELLAERLTGHTMRHYVTTAMEWGTITEPEAKLVYAKVTGAKLLPAEFIEHAAIVNFGATPDAFVGADGLLECKCPTTGTFIDWMLAGVVPDEHRPQMLAQLACTGRKWVDFFAFDPRVKDEKRRYLLRRFEPAPAEIAKIEELAMRFCDELDALFDAFVTAGTPAPKAPANFSETF
jgi:predicted phage-related endonuclease